MQDSSAPIIETTKLGKVYGDRHVALQGLDLEIPRGAVGLLGANGAGKTTLLKILLGLSLPTSGDAHVLGLDTRTDGIAIRERVGYMPESDCLPPGATAADFVGHMAEMSGLPTRAARQRAADVLYQVGLDEERYRLIKGFSTGMKQRVKLAQAIVHDPEIVFLDEPTAGMDPTGRDEMLDLIIRIHRTLGIGVVVSSHILEDIERACDYVVILDEGRVVVSQPIRGMGDSEGEVIVRIDGDDTGLFADRIAAAGVAVRVGETDGLPGRAFILPDNDAVYDLVRDTVADLGLGLRGIRPRSRSLEDLYLGKVGVAPADVLAGAAHG